MSFEWTAEKIATLMALWEEGLTTSDIGDRLGITKNAVVGKVHRLGLPKRGSPIRAKPEPKKDTVSMAKLRPGMCVWPEGEPGSDEFHFCGGEAVEGKPYCAAHCERAYIKPSKDKDRNRNRNPDRDWNRRVA